MELIAKMEFRTNSDNVNAAGTVETSMALGYVWAST